MKKHIKQYLIFITLIHINTWIYGMENDQKLTTENLIKQLTNEYSQVLLNLAKQSQPLNTIYVPLWNNNFITSIPTIKDQLTISTFRLSGGSAAALYIKYSNKHQYAGITHYPITPFKDLGDSVKILCAQARDKQNEKIRITHKKLFIFIPEKIYNEQWNIIANKNYKIYSSTLKEITKRGLKINSIKTTCTLYDSTSEQSKDFKIILSSDKAFIIIDNKKIKF